MKKTFFLLFVGIVNMIERIRGPRQLVPCPLPEEDILKVKFTLDNGSVVTISCEEKRYKLKFTKKWVPDEVISMFRVQSVTTESDNTVIINMFHKKEVYINNLWHFYAGSDILKKVAINAFMDLLKHDSLNK